MVAHKTFVDRVREAAERPDPYGRALVSVRDVKFLLTERDTLRDYAALLSTNKERLP